MPLHDVDAKPAEPLPQLSPTDERRLRNTAMANSLFYVAVCIAVMYLGLMVGHAATLPDGYRNTMLAAAFSGFLAMAIIALYTWRRSVPLYLAHLLATLIVAIIVVNSATQLGFSGDMKQSSNLALITVAVGCFFLSRTWWIVGVISTIGVWVLVTHAYVTNPDWIHYGFMQFICLCLSATVLHVRRRSVVVNGQLRLSDAARVNELETALQNIRVLEGMIPICAWCKKVRDDDGFWGDVERYVGTRTDAEFSHGVCPSCVKEYFGNEHKN